MRDFLDLLDELPDTGRLAKATGPEGELWTRNDELMATLVELVSVAASKDTRLRKPLDLPRPRYPDHARPSSSPAEVAAFFGVVFTPQGDDDDQED